jgi:hypothetical protein
MGITQKYRNGIKDMRRLGEAEIERRKEVCE